MTKWILAGLLVVVVYLALVVLVNRSAMPKAGPVPVAGGEALPRAGHELTILNWNVGYGGLGADADFALDGGDRLLPSTRAEVERYVAGIRRTIADTPADVVALQEIAVASPLSRNVAMWEGVQADATARARIYLADLASQLLPWPLAIEHGLALLSGRRVAAAESHPLPLEDGHWMGLIRKIYALLVVRLPIEGSERQWVVVNVHLAAYDSDAASRMRQLDELLRFVVGEFERGNHVIVAGDWNMLLVDKTFPHTTSPVNLGWVRHFPHDRLPPGWRVHADDALPTVRQLDGPYRAGRNFTAMIDGFLVSPNVETLTVATRDVGFAHSDHQPVLGRFAARPAANSPPSAPILSSP